MTLQVKPFLLERIVFDTDGQQSTLWIRPLKRRWWHIKVECVCEEQKDAPSWSFPPNTSAGLDICDRSADSWWYRSTRQFVTSSAAKLISTSAEMSSRCRSKALEVLLLNGSARKWHFLSPLQSCEQHFRLVDFVFTLVRFNGGALLFLNVLYYLYFWHSYFYRFLFIFRRSRKKY